METHTSSSEKYIYPPIEVNLERKLKNDFRNRSKYFLVTSRFNSQTWQENINYKMKNPKIGCIYCSPEQITKSIPIDSVVFVLEMNNDNNKIMGIGMIKNYSYIDKYHVYNNGNYNRYNYVGKNHILRENMNQKESAIMEIIDKICFTGNRHMKRGQGLRSFPIDILYKCSKQGFDLVDFIRSMFKVRQGNCIPVESNTIKA
jgi:hypothetical protein